MAVRVNLPIYLPAPFHKALRGLGRSLTGSAHNLWGDRGIENSFVAAHMPVGPGKALDFGSGGSVLSLIAARRGFQVVALDLQACSFAWKHPALKFLRGDLLNMPWPSNQFDLVISCSTVEHVGLVGRYGVTEAMLDGDLLAMERLRQLLKPNGVMLTTVPVGRDALFAPWHRVYGARRLPRLLQGFKVEKDEFWVKSSENCWVQSDRQTALDFPASIKPRRIYALGCFLLRRT